jgi:hypothetical protein
MTPPLKNIYFWDIQQPCTTCSSRAPVFKTRIYIKELGKHLEVELLKFTTSSSRPDTPPSQQMSRPAVDAIVIRAITL